MHNLNEHFEKQLASCLLPTSNLYYMTLSAAVDPNVKQPLRIEVVKSDSLESLQTKLEDYDFIGYINEDNMIPNYAHKSYNGQI